MHSLTEMLGWIQAEDLSTLVGDEEESLQELAGYMGRGLVGCKKDGVEGEHRASGEGRRGT